MRGSLLRRRLRPRLLHLLLLLLSLLSSAWLRRCHCRCRRALSFLCLLRLFGCSFTATHSCHPGAPFCPCNLRCRRSISRGLSHLRC